MTFHNSPARPTTCTNWLSTCPNFLLRRSSAKVPRLFIWFCCESRCFWAINSHL